MALSMGKVHAMPTGRCVWIPREPYTYPGYGERVVMWPPITIWLMHNQQMEGKAGKNLQAKPVNFRSQRVMQSMPRVSLRTMSLATPHPYMRMQKDDPT
jgi:hypothetical protein